MKRETRKDESQKITVRFATETDLNWFVKINKYSPAEALARKIRDREVLVASIGGKPVGALAFGYLWETKPFISQIFVIRSRRGQGVGKTLLRYFERFLRKAGCSFYLSSTMPTNPGGQRFHLGMKFQECGYLAGINEDGVGEIFYRKDL